MATTIRSIDYFYCTTRDRPGEAYRLLERLAAGEVNLLAFNAIPIGIDTTQLVLFPENSNRLMEIAEENSLVLTGPQHAFLIQGDDRLGALTDLHQILSQEQINVAASTGVTDGRGGFGYILHVRPEDWEKAAQVLGV